MGAALGVAEERVKVTRWGILSFSACFSMLDIPLCPRKG